MPDLVRTIRAEITDDPLLLGYTGMTDQEVTDSLNALTRERAVESLSSADIYDAIDPTEYTVLSSTEKAMLSDIFSLSEVRVQGNTRDVIVGIFPGGGTTLTNLTALLTTPISRATELSVGVVKIGHVIEARV